MPLVLKKIQLELGSLKDPAKAKLLQRFFKTKKGEYGEGDIFYGIVVPEQRKLVKKYWQKISLSEVDLLLKSKVHEKRLIGALILVAKFQKADEREKRKIFQFYLSHTRHINNWDLVDLSAPNIVGEYLQKKDNKILYKLAKSKSLWERRIAILSTFAFIKQGNSSDGLAISKILLNDSHDLIHKAVGWMLREIGKRCDEKILINFLEKYCKKMPRTMLRYSIERLPENIRKIYLNR